MSDFPVLPYEQLLMSNSFMNNTNLCETPPWTSTHKESSLVVSCPHAMKKIILQNIYILIVCLKVWHFPMTWNDGKWWWGGNEMSLFFSPLLPGQSFVRAGTEPGDLGVIRKKLLFFLETSQHYRPEKLLTRFPFDSELSMSQQTYSVLPITTTN